MILSGDFRKWVILPLIIITPFILLLSLKYLAFTAILFTVILFFYFVNKKYAAPVFIFSFLVITSDLSENLRAGLNLFGFIVLGIMFLKEFGFKIKYYPKIPLVLTSFILFYSVVLLISSLFSQNIILSLSECLRQFSFFLLIYLFYALLSNEKENYKSYIHALILSGIVIALSIIISFLFLSNQIYFLQTVGAVHEGGYIKNVASAGGILIASISLSLIEVLKDKNKFNTLIVIALFIQLIGLLLTGSRAAYLGSAVSVIFILFTLRRKLLRNILSWSGIVLLFLLFISPPFFEVVFSFLRGERVFSNNRYLLWPIAIDIFQDNPVFGVGPGMFKYYIYKYLPVMIGSWDEQQIRWLYENAGSGHAHNYFLFLTSELGLAGLICAVGLLITFYIILKRTFLFNISYPGTYSLLVAIAGIGSGFFVRSFFEATGFLSYGWIYRDLPFWIVFVIMIKIYYVNEKVPE